MAALADGGNLDSAIFTFLSVLLLSLVSVVLFMKIRKSKQPPCHSGWIPWLGCAIEFGKEPLHFLGSARKRYGSIFTLQVAGKRLTFLTDAADFKYFFNSSDVNFQAAVQEPVLKAAGISEQSFKKFHTKNHDLVKGRLAPANLATFCGRMNEDFKKQLASLGKSGTGDLYKVVRRAMYVAVVNNLFGQHVIKTASKSEMDIFEKNFVRFDEDFEYGTQLPEIFLREWSKAKKYLLSTFHEGISKLQGKKNRDEREMSTLLYAIMTNTDYDSAHRFSVLMLWASLANAIPITFWTLAYIFSLAPVHKRVLEEVSAVFGSAGEQSCGFNRPITEEDLRSLPFLKCCILEAIRLRSPGAIARRVTKSFVIKDYTIPKGDMLLLSPFWAHRNPDYFPDPCQFKPERWEAADLDKNLFLDGFIAFGGGRYQCPGRWFALLEIQMFVAMFIHRFNCTLNAPIPDPSPLHLVGTQLPLTELHFEYAQY